MNEKKIYLSNTSIRTFFQCKRKFKYSYIDRINISERIPNKYISFGNSMHLTLADFNLIKDNNYRTLDNLHNLLRKNWIRDGYESREEEREFGLMGIDMLSNYYSNPLDKGTENLLIEQMVYKDFRRYILCGKIDKVYIAEDGSIEILDYKTGNTISPIDDLQLPIYLILAKEKTGLYPSKVSLYYLSQNKKITKDINRNYFEEYTNAILQICNDILDEKNFEYNPNSYCKSNCKYYNLCDISKDESQAILSILDSLNNKSFDNYVF